MDKIKDYHQLLKTMNGDLKIPATQADNTSAKELISTLIKYSHLNR